MSKNLEIVSLFLSDFYRDKRIELSEIISPKFRYQSPFFGEVNFSEYTDWMSRLSNQRSVTAKTSLQSADDEVFEYQFIMKVLDFVDGFDEEMLGNTKIIIKNGLIEYVEITYDDEKSKPEKFKKIRTKLLE